MSGNKKKFPVALSLVMGFILLTAGILSGCTLHRETISDSADSEKLQVVTTIFPQYDFVRQIAGDYAEVKMLLKPGEETHSYEPTPQDIITIQKADLFIYVGGENDEWVEGILDSPEMKEVHTLRLVDCVDTTLEEEQVEGMQKERGHEHEEETSAHSKGETKEDHEEHVHTMDEHVWTSPVNAAEIVDKIAEELCESDPEHASEYKENAKEYAAQLLELDKEFRQVVEQADKKILVFGDRFPFRYFAAEYGLEYYAAFSGCAADTEPNAATMAFLINKVRDEKLKVILKMELSNDNIAKAISEATGAKVKVFYSSHNISAEQFENGVTYVDLMKENVETLKEALRACH